MNDWQFQTIISYTKHFCLQKFFCCRHTSMEQSSASITSTGTQLWSVYTPAENVFLCNQTAAL